MNFPYIFFHASLYIINIWGTDYNKEQSSCGRVIAHVLKAEILSIGSFL